MSYSTSGPVETILRKEDTVDPVAGNDNTQGYAIKSRWINTSSNEEWVCTDASTGAAVWELTTAAGDVVSAGTTAQAAVFFTERAANVNTPVPGSGELWLNTDAIQKLYFTADDDVDYLIPRAAANLGNNGILHSVGSSGGLIENNTLFTYNNTTGEIAIFQTAGSSIKMKEGATLAVTPAVAGAGYYWVRNDAPTVPMFTNDDDQLIVLTGSLSGAGVPGAATGDGYPLGTGYVDETNDIAYTLVDNTTGVNVWSSDADGAGGGGGGLTTLSSNELVSIDATEVVIGGCVLDGSSGGTYSWSALGTYNDNGGTGNQDLTILLYDRGAVGTPVAGVLRSTLLFDTSVAGLDTLLEETQALGATSSPGVDADDIDSDEPRMYEIRAKLDAAGAVDTALILNVKFSES
jgi:hypothetical protein